MQTSDYRNLRVWQKAMDLTVEIYSLLKLLPKEETYGLADQIRRAVVSIPSNIAEGNGRISDREFVKFMAISRGSLLELDTQIEICQRIGYVSASQTETSRLLIEEIGKMLNGLISYRLSRISK